MNPYAPKVFTRENPCTKVEIHNCFYAPGGNYAPRPVVEARTEIGQNVPKYLVREEFAVVETRAGVDYYRLTALGVEWLRSGLERQLELHPERRLDCKGLGAPKVVAPRRIIRRTR